MAFHANLYILMMMVWHWFVYRCAIFIITKTWLYITICLITVETHFEKIRHFDFLSKCVKFGTNSFVQSALNLGPNEHSLRKKNSKCVILGPTQSTLKLFLKCSKSVHLHYFWGRLTSHLSYIAQKSYKYTLSRTSGTLASFNRWDIQVVIFSLKLKKIIFVDGSGKLKGKQWFFFLINNRWKFC